MIGRTNKPRGDRRLRLAGACLAVALLSGCAGLPAPGSGGDAAVVIGHDGQGSRTLLLQPVAGSAQLTSAFGPRRHPVTRQPAMHHGIDLAAAAGTPVRAAGDGTVVSIGSRGGYGRYIRIRHDHRYETAYAHLSGYAADLERGSRVRQGEVIGFVGATGRATGPHLHYEILAEGRAVDPYAVTPTFASRLKGQLIRTASAVASGVQSAMGLVVGAVGGSE